MTNSDNFLPTTRLESRYTIGVRLRKHKAPHSGWSPFMKNATALLFILIALTTSAIMAADKPNIVFVLADDLGYGDLGSYGQKIIRTPSLDRMAAEGMRMTVHYSGNNVCAPSRCVLMTGKHPGHAYVRDNRQMPGFPEGQTAVPEGYLQLPLTLKKLGYATGAFGKWGLGPMTSTGDPLKQGIDRFFGFNCQGVAHNHYPTHLWDNDQQIALRNPKFAAHQKLPDDADPKSPDSYTRYSGQDYAADVITEQALQFVRDHKDHPFFLFMPTPVPHRALQVPEDSLKEYEGAFPDEPFVGANGRAYLPHRTPRAAYAAMITRMDREVGRVMQLVQELGLDEKTIFIFSSDNGPLFERYGGTDSDFFKSAGEFRGRKGTMYEGGVRVPCIVRWKGKIAPGNTSDRVTGFEDWLPTLLELAGATDQTPRDIDGISFAPTLFGKPQEPRPFLYRYCPGSMGQQFVRVGNWKAIRLRLHPGPKAPLNPGPIELFDLAKGSFRNNERSSRSSRLGRQHDEIIGRTARPLRFVSPPRARRSPTMTTFKK